MNAPAPPGSGSEGTVTAVSGRSLTISGGDYGTVRVELRSSADVYKDDGRVSHKDIKEGDKVHVSGSSADSIYLVVVNPEAQQASPPPWLIYGINRWS